MGSNQFVIVVYSSGILTMEYFVEILPPASSTTAGTCFVGCSWDGHKIIPGSAIDGIVWCVWGLSHDIR